ncbi:hypothetical protein [Epilithonimonas hominis]|uniref:hypothetical protein n=1 Tax=Epilithonimonas hominis TaxID=420404 RepID=UPI00289FFD3F|nr:hypothetical protein [Epilithonimonas hominis]
MTDEVRAFVESYKYKPLPPITIGDWMKSHNHEIWRTCKDCKEEFDWRMSDYCPKCTSKNFKNENNLQTNFILNTDGSSHRKKQ